MRRVIVMAVAALCLGCGAFGYTGVMARFGSGSPPSLVGPALRADAIEVVKSAREMRLLRAGQVLRRYRVALGGAPDGPKREEGDERTPEGLYRIDWRNPNSVAHLSLHISYPDAEDRARARTAGVSPGGNIMIHGLPNGWGGLGRLHRRFDWTDGCIGVTNAEMREIWSLVADGTPIRITP